MENTNQKGNKRILIIVISVILVLALLFFAEAFPRLSSYLGKFLTVSSNFSTLSRSELSLIVFMIAVSSTILG